MEDAITKELRVELRYRQANEAALKSSLRHAKDLKQRWDEARQSIDAFGAAGMKVLTIGGLVSGAGAVGLVKHLVGVASSAQSARLGLTTLVQSADSIVGGPMAGVNDAFAYSAELIKQLREEAVTTPGTFEDISTAFRDVAVQARMAGASYADIVKLSGNMATVGRVFGFEGGVVSRDVQQMLRGEFGDVATPQLKAIKEQVKGLHQAGKEAEKLALIMRSLELPPELREMFGEGFEGQVATLQDEWAAFAEEAGKPILEWLSAELKEGLKWVKEHRAEVKQWAKDLGEGVRDALIWIKDALKWMIDNREEIIGWAKLLVGATLLSKAVGLVSDLSKGLMGIIGLSPTLGAALAGALGPIAAAVGLLTWLHNTFGGGGGIPEDNEGGMLSKNEIDARRAARDDLRAKQAQLRWVMDMREQGQAALDSPFNIRGRPGSRGSNAVGGGATFDFDPGLQAGTGSGLFGGLAGPGAAVWQGILTKGLDALATPELKVDARGARVTIHQRVDTDNPAQLARASLLAGFSAVARQPIRARGREGSVRLGNGDFGD